MQKQLNIEIVSDVSCPWCIIGYQSLSRALNEFASELAVQIEWKPFELNPGMPAEGQQLQEHLHEKYGSTAAEIEQMTAAITARGASLGFQFNFKKDGRIYNTFNAHRLLYWSRQYNKQTEFKLALFSLYFSEGGNPGNTDDLIKAVVTAGLPSNEARKIIESGQYSTEVRAEEAKYREMGINMVPTFIFNEKYVVTGGLPVNEFAEKLAQIAVNI